VERIFFEFFTNIAIFTYQFLHGDVMHLVFNLLVLYFMGPFLERTWGSKAFLKFYLICGAAGGVVYTVLALFGILPAGSMVGASGAIYGVMAALAILYPQMKVLLWGVIPMTMVRLIILLVVISLITIAFGTDGATPWAPHQEMVDMVASGMTPAEVIQAATGNSAALLGLNDMGTVAVGNSADFVVLNSNPLDDITNTRSIASVYLRGDRVDREGLRAQWMSGGSE